MSIRESVIKKDKQSILTLVRAFSSLIHFWRGEWFVWTGTHYEQVAQQGIAQRAMAFLGTEINIPRKWLDDSPICGFAADYSLRRSSYSAMLVDLGALARADGTVCRQ